MGGGQPADDSGVVAQLEGERAACCSRHLAAVRDRAHAGVTAAGTHCVTDDVIPKQNTGNTETEWPVLTG